MIYLDHIYPPSSLQVLPEPPLLPSPNPHSLALKKRGGEKEKGKETYLEIDFPGPLALPIFARPVQQCSLSLRCRSCVIFMGSRESMVS